MNEGAKGLRSECITDDESQTAYFRLIPSPRRYSRVEHDGEVLYVDKYLHYAISEESIMQSCKDQLAGQPVYHLAGSIDSTPDYAVARKNALDMELDGGSYAAPAEEAIQHSPLKEETRSLSFLSVDICGGTALRRADPKAFERTYLIFLRELGTLVGQFGGTILKTTGDGFISYIDYPAFTQQCDKIIDLGLSCLVMMRESINPALSKANLPTLQIRIGADYGEAQIRHLNIPVTGFSETEVASDALNRAVKLEQATGKDEFWIGRCLYELIHVQYLEIAQEVQFDGSSIGLEGYKVYRMS